MLFTGARRPSAHRFSIREVGCGGTTEETKMVLDDHSAASRSGDLDAAMDRYADDVVFISSLGGVVVGVRQVRALFDGLSVPAGVEWTDVHVEGNVAHVAWKADGVPFGTNTFVVRDGKITTETVSIYFA
jgi:hypothetical protein